MTRTALAAVALAIGATALAAAPPARAQRASLPGSLYYSVGGQSYDWKSAPVPGATAPANIKWLLAITRENGTVEQVASGLTQRRCLALARAQFRDAHSCQVFGGAGFSTCEGTHLVKEARCSPV